MKKSLSLLLIFLGLLLAGFFVGKLIAKSDFMVGIVPDKGSLTLSSLILMLVSGFIFSIAIHELGHLLTGLVQGFRFEYFALLFFGLKRNEAGKIVPFLNTDINTFGGVAATSPTNFDDDTGSKFANILIAGPLTSLLSAVLCFAIMYQFEGNIRFSLLFFGFFNMGIFLATTLPSRTGIFYTDRKRYQRLKSKGKERDVELALMKVITLTTKKENLNSLTEEELLPITQDDSSFFRYVGNFYLVTYHKDRPELQQPYLTAMEENSADIPTKIKAYFDKEIASYKTNT